MKVELRGLELPATTASRPRSSEHGQLFLYDVALEVGDAARPTGSPTRSTTRSVAAAIRDVNERRFDLLEALATAVADALIERFGPESVRVRVRKPEVRPGRTGGRVQRGHRRAAVTLAYVGLGSNLGDREALIRQAAELIGATRLSTIRETEPWGYERPAAVPERGRRARDALAARALLDHLLDVERRLGRERIGPRWGPRTIDLDLLLYGDETIDEPGLDRAASVPARARCSCSSRSPS